MPQTTNLSIANRELNPVPPWQEFFHCKHQLLTYKSRHTTKDNAWGDQPGNDEIYVTKWKDFLETADAKEQVPDRYEKMNHVQKFSEDDANLEQAP